MTNLQATANAAAPAALVRPGKIRPTWPRVLRAWWMRSGRVPLVLHRVASSPDLNETMPSGRPTLAETGALIARAAQERPGGLMNAYVASAIDVALEAEALSDGAPVRRVRLPLHDLVAEVSEALQACAVAAGSTVVHDKDSRWACVAVTDPPRLRKALHHLVLRALSGPGHAGAIRIMVTSGPGASRIAVAALHGGPEPGLFDLAPLTRMLQAIGAALVVGPEQAGVAPMTIQLQPPPPAPLGLGDGELLFGRRA